MTALRKRLTALEGAGAVSAYDHLTDEQLTARMIEVCECLDAAGYGTGEDWRGMIERGEFGELQRIWSCEH